MRFTLNQKRQNCWEYMECGREPGGNKATKLGICPATNDTSFDGINSGNCGGRICWAVAGTFCGGKIQGDFAQKSVSCMSCNVFRLVKAEEGADKFDLLIPGQVYNFSH